MSKKQQQLQELVDTYSYATGIYSRAFSRKNKILCTSKASKTPAFCQLVHQSQGEQDCRRSYLYGGLQAEKLGEGYIYFCPYGLVNWSVPVIEEGHMDYFLVGGPVLMHRVDNLLIEDICQQNPRLKKHLGQLKKYLEQIQIVDTVRVRYLSQLLMKLARNLMVEKSIKLEQKKQFNSGAALIGETIHNLKEDKSALEDQPYPLEKENELIYHVKLGHRKQSQEILNKILGIIYFKSGDNFSIVKSRAIELMVVLARAAIEVGADLEAIFGLEYSCFESINKAEDINQLSHVLTRVLDRFIDCIFTIANVKNRDIIYKAINFIRENYYNNNIKLSHVADHVGLSSSYFSNLFKDETGMSYTEYLHRVRIESAKQLLRGEHSLAQVAQTVGFNDQSYFSRVFKKIEGVSPGKWKKQ